MKNLWDTDTHTEVPVNQDQVFKFILLDDAISNIMYMCRGEDYILYGFLGSFLPKLSRSDTDVVARVSHLPNQGHIIQYELNTIFLESLIKKEMQFLD